MVLIIIIIILIKIIIIAITIYKLFFLPGTMLSIVEGTGEGGWGGGNRKGLVKEQV